MGLSEESDALHRRVQAFSRMPQAEAFDGLALDIARFQQQHSPGLARLLARHAGRLETLDDIPAVPVEAFRLTRMALHPKSRDAARFRTSGTTSAECGEHPMRRLDTYRALAVGYARRALGAAFGGAARVVALAEHPGQPPESSLGCMMQFFMDEFDPSPPQASAERWLVSGGEVELGRLECAAELARDQGCPLLLLATAFALVALLDRASGSNLSLPSDSLVMYTGGFKGRTREVRPEALRTRVAELFAIDAERVVGEYGMTELTSQLYEGTAPGSTLRAPFGVYVPPPWLRVTAVDPRSFEPVVSGDVGIARFVDLGNIDSAVSILTEDLVRNVEAGVELLGRRPTSPARGCSLPLESLLLPKPEGLP